MTNYSAIFLIFLYFTNIIQYIFRLRFNLANQINSYSRLKNCVMLEVIYNFKSLRSAFKSGFDYKITFWICGIVLWIHKGSVFSQMLSCLQKIYLNILMSNIPLFSMTMTNQRLYNVSPANKGYPSSYYAQSNVACTLVKVDLRLFFNKIVIKSFWDNIWHKSAYYYLNFVKFFFLVKNKKI